MKKGLTKEQILHLERLKANLDDQTESVIQNIYKIKELLADSNLRTKLNEANYEPYIELFHGIDGYDLRAEILNLHPDCKENDWEFIEIFNGWDKALSTSTDTESNGEKSRLYSWVRSSIIYEKQEEIFFNWLTSLWHKEKLYGYNFNGHTIQNNSVEMFDLNRVAWHDFLNDKDTDNTTRVYEHVYPMELSDFEIVQRIKLKQAPKFKSYWRVFEKDSDTVAISSYHTEYKILELDENHNIKAENSIGQCNDWRSTQKFIHQFTTDKLTNGYREIPLQSGINFDDDSLDFDVLEFKTTNLLSDQELSVILQPHEKLVSQEFASFIKRFYKVDLVNKKYAFPISDNNFKKLNSFVYPNQKDPILFIDDNEYLKIGLTKDSLSIALDQSGAVSLIQRNNKALPIADNFLEFIQSIFEYDFIEAEPVYFAEKGDIEFFKNYIKDNYIDNKFGFGYTPLHFAIKHPDLVKFLLENGADPNKLRMPGGKDIEKSIVHLKNHDYDPSAWINAKGGQFETAFNNWNFKSHFPDMEVTNYKHPVTIPKRNKSLYDALKFKKLELAYRSSLPPGIKNFLRDHAGAQIQDLWIKTGINGGCYLKMDRILNLDEIPSFIKLHKAGNRVNGLGKEKHCLPIAKTISYETIYIEKKNGKFSLGIDSQYEITNWLSTRSISRGDDMIPGFLKSLYHENQIFQHEAKAILKDDKSSIKSLIEKNWDPNYPLHPFGTPLGLAMYLDNFEMVDLLLEGGAEIASVINNTDYFFGAKKPLEAAMTMCSLDMVKYLISKGVLEFDPTCDYFDKAKMLFQKSGRDHLMEVLPILKKACT